MQALGAYGFLGIVKNKPTLLRHIRQSLPEALREVAVEQGSLARSRALAGTRRFRLVNRPCYRKTDLGRYL